MGACDEIPHAEIPLAQNTPIPGPHHPHAMEILAKLPVSACRLAPDIHKRRLPSPASAKLGTMSCAKAFAALSPPKFSKRQWNMLAACL
jgi:hypothetical protein